MKENLDNNIMKPRYSKQIFSSPSVLHYILVPLSVIKKLTFLHHFWINSSNVPNQHWQNCCHRRSVLNVNGWQNWAFLIKKITNPFQKVYFLRSMFEEKLNLLLLDQTHLEYFIGANIQTHWEVSGKNKAFSTSRCLDIHGTLNSFKYFL